MLTAVISPRCQLKDESGPEREADLGVEPKCLSHSLGVLFAGRQLPGQAEPCCHSPLSLSLPILCRSLARAGKVGYGHKVGNTLIPASFYPQFLSDGYVAHLGQLEAGSHSHPPSGPPRAALAKSSYAVAAPVDFLRKQSQLLRSRGPSQVDREGPGTPPTTLARGKTRSISLKLDSEE